jgi:hypothetical protein
MLDVSLDPEAHDPCPEIAPLAGGEVPQVMVRFTGRRVGKVRYRGPVTGNSYRFDAIEPCNWVHEADVEHFCRLVEFDVLEHTRLDPVVQRTLRLINHQIQEQIRQHSIPAPAEPKTPGARKGRPRIPEDDLRLLLHLRKHVTHAWTIAQLAFEFAKDAVNPVATIKQRLYRARREIDPNSGCRLCVEQYDPTPPTFRR